MPAPSRRSLSSRGRTPEHGRPHAVAELEQRLDGLDRLLSSPRVALLHERHHDALDEARLALGARAVHPQMPGFDAELHELRGELGDAEPPSSS